MRNRYSIAELQQRTNEIMQEAVSSKEPVFISQGTRSSVLLIDADTYLSNMQALSEFKRIYDTERSIKPKLNAQPQPVAKDVSGSESEGALGDDTTKRYAWRCTICGYIEYADELPDDYKCPICSMGKEFFERIEV